MGDLDRVRFGGVAVDRRTRSMLAEAQRLANEQDPSIGKFKLCQGCWSHASASSGTHGGPGAFDMYTAGYSKEQKEIVGLAFREVGFASWRRRESQGPWQEHWHGIAMGTEGLPPIAASQVKSYLSGHNGLKGNGRDTDDRPSHIRDWEDYKKARGPLDDDPPDSAAHDAKVEPPDPDPEPYAIDSGDRLNARRDTDSDGLTDEFEKLAGTDVSSTDTDRDGLADGYEAITAHTDPLSNDTDRDGQTDALELAAGTDAGRLPGMAGVVGVGAFAENVRNGVKDADQDGVSDHVEMLLGTNARKSDTDQVQLSDASEVALGTNPRLADSDQDGVVDGLEVQNRTDPASSPVGAQAYRAPALNGDPYRIETGATLALASRPSSAVADRRDSDADGLTDEFEKLAGTDANKADTDNDRLTDATEAALGTSPLQPDTDADGLLDSIEAQYGSDPLSPGSALAPQLGGPALPDAGHQPGSPDQPGLEPGGLFN